MNVLFVGYSAVRMLRYSTPYRLLVHISDSLAFFQSLPQNRVKTVVVLSPIVVGVMRRVSVSPPCVTEMHVKVGAKTTYCHSLQAFKMFSIVPKLPHSPSQRPGLGHQDRLEWHFTS